MAKVKEHFGIPEPTELELFLGMIITINDNSTICIDQNHNVDQCLTKYTLDCQFLRLSCCLW